MVRLLKINLFTRGVSTLDFFFLDRIKVQVLEFEYLEIINELVLKHHTMILEMSVFTLKYLNYDLVLFLVA